MKGLKVISPKNEGYFTHRTGKEINTWVEQI
jgi:hypothetical protein